MAEQFKVEEGKKGNTLKILLILAVVVAIPIVLLVFAVVMGMLIFVYTTPAGTMTCSSGAPSKINVVTHSLDNGVANGSLGKIVLTNVSGGQISLVDVDSGSDLFEDHDDTGNFTFDGDESDTLGIGNNEIEMKAGPNPGTYGSGEFTVAYVDQTETLESITIACQGGSITIT